MVGLFGQSGKPELSGVVGCPWEMRRISNIFLVSTQYDDLKKASDEIVSELQKTPGCDKHPLFP